MNTTQGKSAEKTKDFKKEKEFKISGDWAAQSKKLKEEYSQLTDADLKLETGKENELLSRLSTRLNKKREEVISIIKKSEQTKAEVKA